MKDTNSTHMHEASDTNYTERHEASDNRHEGMRTKDEHNMKRHERTPTLCTEIAFTCAHVVGLIPLSFIKVPTNSCEHAHVCISLEVLRYFEHVHVLSLAPAAS